MTDGKDSAAEPHSCGRLPAANPAANRRCGAILPEPEPGTGFDPEFAVPSNRLRAFEIRSFYGPRVFASLGQSGRERRRRRRCIPRFREPRRSAWSGSERSRPTDGGSAAVPAERCVESVKPETGIGIVERSRCGAIGPIRARTLATDPKAAPAMSSVLSSSMAFARNRAPATPTSQPFGASPARVDPVAAQPAGRVTREAVATSTPSLARVCRLRQGPVPRRQKSRIPGVTARPA